ncbi:hypothetical protein M5689_009859 [Euphorbia peplus]|nr:hypothetical protein M5689_009859 [Euphorbia peplus]
MYLFSRNSFEKSTSAKLIVTPSKGLTSCLPLIALDLVIDTTKRPPHANALTKKANFSNHALSNPNKRTIILDGGGFKAVKTPQSIYKERLQKCRHSVLTRITLVKGEATWKTLWSDIEAPYEGKEFGLEIIPHW